MQRLEAGVKPKVSLFVANLVEDRIFQRLLGMTDQRLFVLSFAVYNYSPHRFCLCVVATFIQSSVLGGEWLSFRKLQSTPRCFPSKRRLLSTCIYILHDVIHQFVINIHTSAGFVLTHKTEFELARAFNCPEQFDAPYWRCAKNNTARRKRVSQSEQRASSMRAVRTSRLHFSIRRPRTLLRKA